MSLFVAALILSQAPWTAELEVKPKPTSLVVGDGAPPQTLVFPGRRSTTLKVRGTTTVTLRVHGLMKKTPRQPEGPGTVSVRVGREPPQVLRLSNKPVEGWSVPKRPLFMVTQGTTLVLAVPAGGTVTLQASKDATAGFALGVGIEDGVAPGLAVPAPEEEPALAGLEGGPPPAAVEDEDEPQLISNVEADKPLTRPRGFTVVPPVPREVKITSDMNGEESFYETGSHQTFTVGATGPGLISFDFHAHRDPARKETLEPVVVGVLLDDVLVQTVSIEEPKAPEFRVAERPYALSQRVELQLPIPSGAHNVTLSLSDEAVAGASIRPRFTAIAVRESVTAVPPPAAEPPPEPVFQPTEPPKLTTTPAPQAPPRRRQPAVGVSASVAAGAWVPVGLSTLGARLAVDAGFWLLPELGVSVGASYGWARYESALADRRAASGVSRMEVDANALPLTVDVRTRLRLAGDLQLLLGAGAGARVAWGETRALDGRREEESSATPVGLAHAAVTLPAPGGAFLVRLAHVRALEADRVIDRGETSLSAGWSFEP